jgi:membrane dipeptidase
LARTGSDVQRIVAAGKVAMPLAIEGGHAIENSLEILADFHSRGVSSMTLTHNVSHDWADSSADDPKWGGLNELGRDVVREMNRLGMVVDVSHVSDSTFFDVLEVTSDPVILSHSGVRGVQDYPNITAGLKRRGYGDEDVKKIMGGNLLRVWLEVTG